MASILLRKQTAFISLESVPTFLGDVISGVHTEPTLCEPERAAMQVTTTANECGKMHRICEPCHDDLQFFAKGDIPPEC